MSQYKITLHYTPHLSATLIWKGTEAEVVLMIVKKRITKRLARNFLKRELVRKMNGVEALGNKTYICSIRVFQVREYEPM